MAMVGVIKLVKPDPLPLKDPAVTIPLTSKAVAGLVLPIPTPPVARIRNWLLEVAVKSASVESPQTKSP